VSRAEVENFAVLSFARFDVEDLTRKVTILEDGLAEERRAWEASEKEHQEHFMELTLLHTRGSELCHAIISPPRARHRSNGMRLATLRHTKMDGELAAYQVALSSTMDSVLT
jgi:hypothetical protein